MNWKKFAIGGIIGGVVYFFLGWLVYAFLLKDFMSIDPAIVEVIERKPEDMQMSFLIISCLAWGSFLSFLFIKWAGISTVKSGAIAGAIIGAWFALVYGASSISMMTFWSIQNTIADMIGNAICSAATGAAIGYYFNKTGK